MGSIDTYIQQTVDRINQWRALGGETRPPVEPPAVPLNFGPHPMPSFMERRIVTKPAGSAGRGWNFTSNPRGPRLAILFFHHTAAPAGWEKEECWQLFSIGGERVYQALTDAVLSRDGTGYLLNDPWSDDPMEGSGRIPWASGPTNNVGAILLPFIQRYGANAINDMGLSTEHCHTEGEPWGDVLLDASAKLHGWAITRMRIPWNDWPRNPNIGGLWASYDHDDAASTTCPNIPADVRKALVEAVRYEAKVLQTGSTVTPPPIDPTPPAPDWPFDFTREQVAGFWAEAGGLTRYLPDGTTRVYPFDPTGPIGAYWMARARQEGVFPAALEWFVGTDGGNYVTFGSAGDTDWVLAMPSFDSRADWQWVDRREA